MPKPEDFSPEVQAEAAEITNHPEIAFYHRLLGHNSELRNCVAQCPLCHSNIADRTISIYQGLVSALARVHRWCQEHHTHEFRTSEIKHLLSKNDYARFGDLIRFGGLVYKPEAIPGTSQKSRFGLNMERVEAFLAGTYEIPVQIVINQITDAIVGEVRVNRTHFPDLIALLQADGLYDPTRQVGPVTPVSQTPAAEDTNPPLPTE